MSAKDLPGAELRRRTNLDSLLGPRPVESLPDVPSGPIALEQSEPKRSTTDPLEINFYQVDIIEGLAKPQVGAPIRWFAWVFLAAPPMLVWPFAVYFIFEGAGEKVRTFGDLLWILAEFGLATVICGFWPYILLRRQPR